MKVKVEELGLKAQIISSELYDAPEHIVKKFLKEIESGTVVLGGGEPKAVVPVSGGTGGRCQRLGIEMLPFLKETDVFAAIASDGLDNSTSAGVIEDWATLQKVQSENIDIKDYQDRWDSLGFYKKTGNELLETGPTQANVSDLMVMYRK